jgi:Lrp/AsnC family transcriptional regulator, leucine-responsive regulatory protein
MNKSRYVTRQIDKIDHAIIAALTDDGRMSAKDLAEHIGLSSPSIGERILKLKDAGAIRGYTVVVDPKVFGLNVAAYVRMCAMPGKVESLVRLLKETPEIVEVEHITGDDCFQARVVVCDIRALEAVVNRFVPFAATHTAVIQSVTVARRLPQL